MKEILVVSPLLAAYANRNSMKILGACAPREILARSRIIFEIEGRCFTREYIPSCLCNQCAMAGRQKIVFIIR